MQAQMDNGPRADDEIDLFELFENLWQQKLLIVLITLVVTAGGAGYAFLATPTYKINAAIGATDNFAASIRLTQMWSENFSDQEIFTTPIMAMYARGETPYSPTSLYLRFSEALISKEMKKVFIEAHPNLEAASSINALSVSYPKRIETQLRLSLNLTTKDRAQIENSAKAINRYLDWAQAAFTQKIQQEASLLTSTEGPVFDDSQPLVSITQYASAPQTPIKPKKMLIVALSVILGGMAGVMIALLRMAIINRRQAS